MGKAGIGGSMARSVGFSVGARGRRLRAWSEALAALKRRVFETLGFGLLLGALLVAAALFSYDPRDPSLDTSVDSGAHNFLGYDGAVLADILRQSLGFAAFVIPIVLFGWSLRLLLDRPLRSLWRKLGLLPVALVLAALALSILDQSALCAAPGCGGAVGWGLQQLLALAGLGTAGLPIAMMAAAGLGLSLLLMLGLSWRDWRDLGAGAGSSAGRVAVLSGRGTVAAAGLGGRLLRRWWQARSGPAGHPSAASEPRLREVVARLPDRREPRIDRGGPPQPGDKERERTGLIRFIAPQPRPPTPGRRGEEERQQRLDLVPDEEPVLPSLELLEKPPAAKAAAVDEDALAKNARMLETVLEDYGVRGQIVQVRPGPVVTLYELEPAPGIKASRIIGLADDIARSMSAISVRVAVVPGRTVIGIELPNRRAETVFLRELLDSPTYEKHPGRLALILGKDISGEPILADLARMPHLLIAGTTGSGKSVGINTMILSILYRMPPDRCKFIMVDPKMLELSVYDGIPHLLAPVVTDPRKAVLALKWTVREMENRYRKMSKLGVRNIDGFNARLAEAAAKGESLVRKVQTGFDPRDRRADLRAAALRYQRIAADHRRRGRDGRSDAGRRQGHRGGDPTLGADGARGRHSHYHGHPASVGRRDHRHDQGEFPDPDQLSGHLEDRQPDNSRRRRRRATPRPRRHALHGGRGARHPCSWPVCLGRGGRARRLVPQGARRA